MNAHTPVPEHAPLAEGMPQGPDGVLGPEDAEPAEEEEIDLPDVLPELDLDDADVLLGDGSDYGDWLGGAWLERSAEDVELDDERAGFLDVGLTLDLNESDADEELAQLLDLDVGELLTSLPIEVTELDLDALALQDGAFGVSGLRVLRTPDGNAWDGSDEELGDDERFPAFDDSLIAVPRPARRDGLESELISDDDVVSDEDVS
jgi:hypothetical protein